MVFWKEKENKETSVKVDLKKEKKNNSAKYSKCLLIKNNKKQIKNNESLLGTTIHQYI